MSILLLTIFALPSTLRGLGGGAAGCGVAAFGSALPIFASAWQPSEPAAKPKPNTAMSGKRTFLDMTRCLLNTDSTGADAPASPSAGYRMVRRSPTFRERERTGKG